MNTKKLLLRSSIVLYFVIAFEVLIMISPFAGFFYSAFNPVLLKLAAQPSTRWLSAFYLPHMIQPQDGFLAGRAGHGIGPVRLRHGRLSGLRRADLYRQVHEKGAVLGGLYAHVRHPQYLALGIAGLGLSILWPRFLTIVLWLIMTIVYYFLAKDEERRMLNAHEATYRSYMNKTGMFLPLSLERLLLPSSPLKKAALMAGFAVVVLGGAFLLRAYTISTLTMWNGTANVAAIAILPEDGFKMEHRMADILALPRVKERLQNGKQYLAYFLPQNYIMQGMIADTGGDWKLYKQHHTIAMITDWVFHPFRHLREGHHAMPGGMHMQHQRNAGMQDDAIKRLIFLSLEDVEVKKPADLFSINALRVPQFMVDVDVHTLGLLDIKGAESWKRLGHGADAGVLNSE